MHSGWGTPFTTCSTTAPSAILLASVVRVNGATTAWKSQLGCECEDIFRGEECLLLFSPNESLLFTFDGFIKLFQCLCDIRWETMIVINQYNNFLTVFYGCGLRKKCYGLRLRWQWAYTRRWYLVDEEFHMGGTKQALVMSGNQAVVSQNLQYALKVVMVFGFAFREI